MEEVTHFRPSTHHHAGKPPRIDLAENSNVNPWSVLRKKHKAKISQMHVEKEKESMLLLFLRLLRTCSTQKEIGRGIVIHGEIIKRGGI